MSKTALSDAYAAGFQNGRASAASVRDEDAGDHCALGFDGWWQNALNHLDRTAAPLTSDGEWIAWDGSLDYPTDVTASTIVMVKTRCGLIKSGNRADYWQWRFRHVDPNDNIIAYRVLKS